MARTFSMPVLRVVASAPVALAGFLMLALLAATPAFATVTGGCTLTATSTSGGPIDLTTTSVWHLRSTDRVSVSGTAPRSQTGATASAYAFGFAVPVASGKSDGATAAHSTDYEIAAFAMLGRVFSVSGTSGGPDGGCAGQFQIVIDDVNPFLTVLGGGGVVAVLLGLLGLAWAIRKPMGVTRRTVGLVSLGLIGVGGSLILQQTSTPGVAVANPGLLHSAFVDAVVGPTQVGFDPTVLIPAALLTLAVVVLLPFPSQLFNSTLEENHDEIRTALRRLPFATLYLRATSAAGSDTGASRGLLGVLIAVAFVLVSGLLYALLDPGFGLDPRSLVTYAGIVAGLVIVTWAAGLPRRAVHRAVDGDRGRLWIVPGTLIIAAICVLISRVVGFVPGYVYGLILGYQFARALDPRDEGRAGAVGAWWMLALALIAWVTLGAVRTPGLEDSVPAAIVASVLAALVVAGIEAVVFGLLPLRFLPGEAVYHSRRWHWALLYAVGMFGFAWIILNPANGFVPGQGSVSFLSAVALFVGFGLASVLFWGYFRLRRERRPA